MQPPLTHVEVRVLGSLIEKAATTPDTYPLTLSALVAACNQLTNREPVMQLDEDTVSSAIVTLRRRSLLRAIQPAGSRVTKYQHLLNEALDLDLHELAILCVLLLRGPQTLAELHTRTARLADFSDPLRLDRVLAELTARDSGSLVVLQPKRHGQKEQRYAQLLGGAVSETDTPAVLAPAAQRGESQRGESELERRVQQLEQELAELRAELMTFKAQFG